MAVDQGPVEVNLHFAASYVDATQDGMGRQDRGQAADRAVEQSLHGAPQAVVLDQAVANLAPSATRPEPSAAAK